MKNLKFKKRTIASVERACHVHIYSFCFLLTDLWRAREISSLFWASDNTFSATSSRARFTSESHQVFHLICVPTNGVFCCSAIKQLEYIKLVSFGDSFHFVVRKLQLSHNRADYSSNYSGNHKQHRNTGSFSHTQDHRISSEAKQQ